MSFFESLFSAPPPPVPAVLPKFTAPTALELAQATQPGPAAQLLLTPQQTPSQYLAALQEKQLGEEMVKTLAHGMPDREGVQWAALSAEKVSDKLPPTDVQALQAAKAWAANPTPETQAAAAAAAAKTDLQGPGAMAAQAAAWSAPAGSSAPRLTPHAITAAVLMSAAIVAFPKHAAPKPPAAPSAAPLPELPKLVLPPVPAAPAAPVPPPVVMPPKLAAKAFKSQQPFIAIGMDLASGKLPLG